jgi:hypothetical protein
LRPADGDSGEDPPPQAASFSRHTHPDHPSRGSPILQEPMRAARLRGVAVFPPGPRSAQWERADSEPDRRSRRASARDLQEIRDHERSSTLRFHPSSFSPRPAESWRLSRGARAGVEAGFGSPGRTGRRRAIDAPSRRRWSPDRTHPHPVTDRRMVTSRSVKGNGPVRKLAFSMQATVLNHNVFK